MKLYCLLKLSLHVGKYCFLLCDLSWQWSDINQSFCGLCQNYMKKFNCNSIWWTCIICPLLKEISNFNTGLIIRAVLLELAISQLRTAKHLWIVWRDNAKCPSKLLKVKLLKVKLEQEIVKDASLSPRSSLKSCLLCPFHVSWLMLFITLSFQTIHACFAISIRKWLMIFSQDVATQCFWSTSNIWFLYAQCWSCCLGLKCRSNMADFLKKLPMLHDDKYEPNVNRKKPDVSHEKDIDELVMP